MQRCGEERLGAEVASERHTLECRVVPMNLKLCFNQSPTEGHVKDLKKCSEPGLNEIFAFIIYS